MNSDKNYNSNEDSLSAYSNSKNKEQTRQINSVITKSPISRDPRISQNFSVYNDSSQIIGNKNNGFFGNFCQIIRHKIFLLCAMALANLFFIITAIQYWASNYEKKVLEEKDDNKIFLSFTIVCITSPTLGLFFGGFISSKTGGYESKHSILLCLIFGLLAGISSIPVPWVDDIFYFTLYLWLVLFFGAAILPNLIGIIISSLPPHLRGSANSMTNIITNLFGYLPAPAFYGFIYQHTKDENPRMAMEIIMYSSFIGTILLLIAMYFRYNEKPNEDHISERKTSILSANSNLTNNLAKFYNPNTVININNYENCSRKDDSSSGNSQETIEEVDSENQKKEFNRNINSITNNDSNNNFNGNKFTNLSNSNKSKKSKKKTIKSGSTDFKSKKNLTNSPGKESFDITLIDENSEVFINSQTNLLSGKYSARGINNVSIDSTNKKGKMSRSNSSDIINKANPNFNYNKYLEENVFNQQTENENSQANESEKNKENFILKDNVMQNRGLSSKNLSLIDNKDKNGNLMKNMNNNNNLNISYPISIKTPKFNFVGFGHENFSLEEKGKINDSSNFSSNSELCNYPKSNENTIKKNNEKYLPINVCDSCTSNNLKFSYESAGNNTSEYSLFGPTNNSLSNNKDIILMKNKEGTLIKEDSNENIEVLEEIKVKNYSVKNTKNNDTTLNLENQEILISEQRVDFENMKYKRTESFKKVNEYV